MEDLGNARSTNPFTSSQHSPQVSISIIVTQVTHKKFMKKNSIVSLLILGAFVGGTFSALAIQKAAAEETPEKSEIERTVENIENGVVVTLTSDDPDTVERLQDIPEHPPQGGMGHENVEREVEILDNGVKFTLTSDDSEIVEKLQEHALHGNPRSMKGMMEEVDRNVENIDNGVVITLTSDDPEIVQKLQEHAEGGFMFGQSVQERDE
jgi:acylphosphatase